LKLVVAQISKEMGFQQIQQMAIETLADLLENYLTSVGYLGHKFTELSSRTESNLHDIKLGLKEIGNVTMDDIYNFATVVEDFPFVKQIPEFPCRKAQKQETRVFEHEPAQQDALPKYVPNHLPPFPPAHSYASTPMCRDKISDQSTVRNIRKEKSKEKRHIENSLARLNTKMGSKPITNYDTTIAKPNTQSHLANPYLTQPGKLLQEKSADLISRTPSPIQRDSKHFIKNANKPLGEPNLLEKSLDDRDSKRNYNELEESDRQRKKQRAEQILSLQYSNDIIDQDLLATNINSGPSKPSTTIIVPAPAPPFMEKI